jgi:hypothetical protein
MRRLSGCRQKSSQGYCPNPPIATAPDPPNKRYYLLINAMNFTPQTSRSRGPIRRLEVPLIPSRVCPRECKRSAALGTADDRRGRMAEPLPSRRRRWRRRRRRRRLRPLRRTNARFLGRFPWESPLPRFPRVRSVERRVARERWEVLERVSTVVGQSYFYCVSITASRYRHVCIGRRMMSGLTSVISGASE